MPPRQYNSCEGRSTIVFKTLYESETDDFGIPSGPPVLKESFKESLLAVVLQKMGQLSQFQLDEGSLSECVLTYPDSDWFSAYIIRNGKNEWFTKKADGSKGDDRKQIFFKIDVSDPENPVVKKGTAMVSMPPELNGKQPCQVVDGKCVNPPMAVAKLVVPPKATPARPVSGRYPGRGNFDPGASSSSGPAIQLSAEIEQVLAQKLNLNDTPKESREPFSRDYFENMNNKMTIIEWMVDHMQTADIVSCIKDKNTNAADVRAAEEIYARIPPRTSPYQPDRSSVAAPSGGIVSAADAQVVNIAQNLSPSDFHKMSVEAITRYLIEYIEKKYSSQKDRLEAIAKMCGNSRVLSVKEKESKIRNKTIYYLVDNAGKTVDMEDALEECATYEAERFKGVVSRVAKMVRPVVARARARIASRQAVPTLPEPSTSKIYTVDEIKELSANDLDTALDIVHGYARTLGYSIDPDGKIIIDGKASKFSTKVIERLVKEMNARNVSSARSVRSMSSASSAQSSQESLESWKERILTLSSEEQIKEIVQFADAQGVFKSQTNKRGQTVLINNEEFRDVIILVGEGINDALDALIEIEKATTAFGRRRRRCSKKTVKRSKKTVRRSKTVKRSKKGKKCSKKDSDTDSESESESEDCKPCKRVKKGKVSKKQSAHRKRFAMAVKKCKGKSNYQGCMKKALKCKRSGFGKKKVSKTYTKTGALRKKFLVSRGRKSPNVSATSKAVGTKMVGNDGNMWVIKKTVTGVKRWVKV